MLDTLMDDEEFNVGKVGELTISLVIGQFSHGRIPDDVPKNLQILKLVP